ncbi:hypothetical protein ES703_90603 [subsurface metagenome]
MCRDANVNICLEYKHNDCRFDAVIYDKNNEILAIIEFKNRWGKYANYVNTDTKQHKKYISYGIPVIYVLNFSDVGEKFNVVMDLLKEVELV